MSWHGGTLYEVKLCLILVLILSGCINTSASPEATAIQATQREMVSEDAVAAFLEMLETGDYHAIERSGAEIFREGLYIPNHHRVFRDYPSEDLPDGQIRYDLLIIKGKTGAAWVHLFLEKESGKIVQFSAGEATFEGNG
jgi:hypothetical protein